MKKIAVTALSGLLIFGTMTVQQQSPAFAAPNPIVVENQQPGSTAWQLGPNVADDAHGQIQGYASATSVNQGESLTLYVTVNPAQQYTIDIYRIGSYSGSGGRLRSHVPGLSGTPQPTCPTDATTGIIVCNWSPGYTFTVPSDWTSGIYLAQLTNAAGWQSYVIFAVKDGRPAAFVYQQPVNTYQAYNNYPDNGTSFHDPNGTGKSLYGWNSYGAQTPGTNDWRAVKVSFDRPYSGAGVATFFTFEYNLIRWLEGNGYDVTYTTDVDTHANGALLQNHKGFFSTGHDEYWSNGMYDAVQAARDVGVNLAFFGANAVYWQVRYESSASGVPNRVMVCYKDASIDPVQGPLTTVQWRQPPVNRPEQSLLGIQFMDEVNWNKSDGTINTWPYVVTNSSHWIYAGTGFKDGDSVPGLVFYEMDRYQSNFPGPTGGTNQTFLSHSNYLNWENPPKPEYQQTSIYQAPSGAWVFAAGTMVWSWGLDNYYESYKDARIQQMTVNLLNAFLNGAPKTVHDLKLTAPTTVTAGQAFNITVVAEDAQGSPVPGYTGTVHFASGDTASGVVLPPDSTLANGQGTFSVTLATTGSQTLTVSDAANALSTTATLTVSAQHGAASHFVLATTATPTSGKAFSFTVTAQDSSGNTDPSYSGTVHFTSTDTSSGVQLPADATLTSGAGTFSATLIKAGAETITATDTVTASITGGLNVTVGGAGATRLALTTTATPTAGAAFSFTVTAQDSSGNTDPTYAGSVHFTSTDTSSGVVLPADTTLANGIGTFSATLIRAGAQTITGTDTATASITGALSASVRAAAATRIGLATSATPRAGTAFSLTATALDPYGNTDTSYAGTVHFTTTDASVGVVLPANSTLASGTGTFSATLIKAGAQTITATDMANATITGGLSVTVRAASATLLALATGNSTPTAGTAFSFSVTAKDPYGNTDTAYAGRVHFTTTDTSSGVVLPADATLANGTGTFAATLIKAGAQTITARDTVTATIAGTLSVTVKPGAAASLTLIAPATVTASQSFSVTVTAKDAYGNVATGYRGAVHFTSSDILATLPADYTFTSGDAGTRNFSVTLVTVTTQTVTVTDTANGALTASAQINVKLPLLP